MMTQERLNKLLLAAEHIRDTCLSDIRTMRSILAQPNPDFDQVLSLFLAFEYQIAEADTVLQIERERYRYTHARNTRERRRRRGRSLGLTRDPSGPKFSPADLDLIQQLRDHHDALDRGEPSPAHAYVSLITEGHIDVDDSEDLIGGVEPDDDVGQSSKKAVDNARPPC